MTRYEAIKAAGHPVRVELIRIALNRDGSWSPKAMAAEIGLPLPNISYHVKILVELGAIRQTKTRPRRGAVEHYYVLNPTGKRELLAILPT